LGLRVGFININDMSNNDVGQGVVYAYEAYEAKKRVAAFRAPVCFINLGLIPYRHRYWTYLYYLIMIPGGTRHVHGAITGP
jgi:hypothetical protein